jgi:hypothetical protein
MLKGLLNSIKKAKTPQAVRSAASEARQKVLDNSKITGEKEKDALAEVTSFKNKLIKEMKDASSSTPKAKPSGVAGERAKVRKNEQEAKVTPKKGSITKNRTVSATDIKQAKTANQFDTMQRRIDDMPDGLGKKTMQDLLDRQRKSFEDMQSAEVSRMSRKQQQSASDRKAKPVTLPPMPFYKGGKVKMYNKGGYANCGASVSGTQKK